MTPEQINEARRWTSLRGWRWVAGMLDVGGDRVVDVDPEGCPWIVDGGGEVRQARAGELTAPDETDPATRGCLLALAREITGRPGLTTIPSFDVVNPGDPAWCARWPEHCVPSLGRVCAHETAALLWKCEDFERAKAQRPEVTP